jgi:signal transduction histidine kinase
MQLSPSALAWLALLLAAWTFVAAWFTLRALGRERQGRAARLAARRMGKLLEESPAIPMMVRPDGRIEAPERLARWLGLTNLPRFLSEVGGEETGIPASELEDLRDAARSTQKTGAPFSLLLHPTGSNRTLAVRGQQADPTVAQGGAIVLWWFDFTRSHDELKALRAEAEQARSDFAALAGLIEAAPMPMWFRGTHMRLKLVNSAYVKAVEAESAEDAVQRQVELVETVDGLTAAQVAQQARDQDLAVERIVQATIGGQRRALRVSDLPLGHDGVAGYAVDIEEMEELSRAFRAFREVQRSMLDQLSVGVAQFDAERRLASANQPFHRIFALPPNVRLDPPHFDRFLDMARDAGRLPEARDFPAWRRELGAWFNAGAVSEDAWTLSDGTHLRVLAQPMPDGGLVLVAEDRSEQLALSATRDTLLRTRTATFDSLFESLAVFAPDGRMQLWNRRFPEIWGVSEDFLDQHPHVESLLERIGPQLAKPAQRQAIGDVVRSATLDRRQRGGRVEMANGRTLEFAGVPLPDGNGLLTVLDVTDSKKAEDALRERNTALEEADAVKTRFLANMSYEFRTPLTSIGGFAELLQSGLAGPLSEQAQEYVAAIVSSVERLGQQIESVLDLTQSEAGLMPLAKDEIDILPFVTRVVREREDAIEEKHLTVDLRGDRSAGKTIGDERQLARAFGNIIDNALEAAPKGGRILVALSRHKLGARIVVSDNGPGMRPADSARVLDGYSMGPDGKPSARRTGLGLPLARQLVEAHGGKVELQSEKGMGTTVTITLP